MQNLLQELKDFDEVSVVSFNEVEDRVRQGWKLALVISDQEVIQAGAQMPWPDQYNQHAYFNMPVVAERGRFVMVRTKERATLADRIEILEKSLLAERNGSAGLQDRFARLQVERDSIEEDRDHVGKRLTESQAVAIELAKKHNHIVAVLGEERLAEIMATKVDKV